MAEATPVEIQDKLEGIDYPATKQQLISFAQDHGEKNPDVIDILSRIPDQMYNSPIDVSKAVEDVT